MITNNSEDQEVPCEEPQLAQYAESPLEQGEASAGYEATNEYQVYTYPVPGLLPFDGGQSFSGAIAEPCAWGATYPGTTVDDTSRYGVFSEYPASGACYEMDRRKKQSSGSRAISSSASGYSAGSAGEGSSSQSYGLSSDNDLNLSRSHAYDMGDNLNPLGKKTEMAIYQLFSEDMRISKILRRLCSESNGSIAIELCEKLQQAIQDPANAAYIRRSFDCLADSLLSVVKYGPTECFDHAASAFGLIGYVIRHDFNIFKNWIFKHYETMKEIRNYVMKALKITLIHDAATLDLMNHSDRLIITLKDSLECADRAEDFISVSDVIAEFARNYKKSFEKHFTDIVDIVVGWHLETEQSRKLKEHCSLVLQSFSDFFIKKDEFTFGLMSQFLEDIAAFGDDIENPNSGESKSPSLEKSVLPEVSVGSFVGAFNSILKCLSPDPDSSAFNISPKLLEQAIESIQRVAYQSLKLTSCQETVQAVNEFFVLVLSHDRPNVACDFDKIFDIIKLEMSVLQTFNDIQISSFLFMLLQFVRDQKANTPIAFVTFVLDPESEEFKNFKMSPNVKHYKLLVKLYHEVLSIKNVPILQEAYKHILTDMRIAMRCISECKKDEYTLEQAECVLNFYLLALADLATQTSSIIGMYALQPSILELLIKEMDLANMDVWAENPTLHYSCVNLLAVHCVKNNNYILSSSLLINNVFSKLSIEDTSPTAENFSLIMKFLGEVINAKHVAIKTVLKLLEWAKYVYHQCAQYALTLESNPSFVEIGKSICKLSVRSYLDVVLECARCIDILFSYDQLNIELLNAIAEVCCIHVCSTNCSIREAYLKLFAKLPLNVALKEAQETRGVVKSKDLVINDLQRWYISSPISATLRENEFKQFFKILSQKGSSEFIGKFLLSIFPKCWIAQKGRGADFFGLATNNLNYLLAWAEWEVAEFCVNNKLRTPIGKPQETLLRIEALVREGAQMLSEHNVGKMQNVDALIVNQKHIRILLRFLECLEKSVYNAAEGTSFAIPAPDKPVRTFFRINTPTCKEWFNRIRTAVDLVAMHSIEPEMIIRCSESMLKALVTGAKTAESIFEHTLMLYVWALIRNNETDTLHGLYLWAKRVSGKRFTWIKSATEHAAGHREKAAEGYMNILTTKDDDQLGSHVREFIGDQLIDCLYFTNQWDQLKDFTRTHSPSNDRKLSVPLVSLLPDQIKSIQLFEELSDASVIKLANWEIFNSRESLPKNCSYNNLLSISENTLMNFVISDQDPYEELNLDVCKKVIQSGLEEYILTKPKDTLNHIILLNHIAHIIEDLKPNPNQTHQTNLASLKIDKTFGSVTLNRALRWADFLTSAYNLNASATFSLNLKTASIARKEGNLKFCKKSLEKYLKKVSPDFAQFDLEEIGKALASNHLSNITWNDDTIRGIYEVSKWLYAQNGKQEEAIHLESICCLGALSMGNATEDLSRSLLTLSDWLGQTSENLLTQEDSLPLLCLLEKMPPMQSYQDESIERAIPSLDKAVGKLIHCSTQLSPNLAKTWSAFGTWCYRWGRKVFEQRASGGLRQSDIDAIKLLLPQGSADEINKVVTTLCELELMGDDEEIGPNEASSTEVIENQLRSLDILANVNTTTIQSIVEIWRQAHKSVYSYYEMAASAYFKYLNLASTSEENKKNGDASTVTATLRLLRLIVKHALGLQEVLEEGLSTTPTYPWKVITPQLFSRLNHHESYVRKRVSELLCRVANDSPHLIIFPAVVGAVQENTSNYSERNTENNTLTTYFNSLLSTLSKQAPETVQQVQLLVRELKRITLLWDEYWLHSLAQLYSEYSELFRTIESDARKSSEEKMYLVAEKHRVLMNHVIEDMQRLAEVTSRPAETNYERSFQEKYSKIISATIEDLEKPFDPEKPSESSHKIKQLYLIFQQRLQRSSQSTLKTVDISPVLANMKNTAISMPGVEASENNQIYIKSMDSVVYILPTKTKPKKLAFFGSNGKRYTYLFKGLEDLHLDERIMQFLSIANTMISKPVEYNGYSPNYRAYHYSVIPLGPRSGLISWVDGVVPIFGLYKKWQQREAANPKKGKEFTVARPSELFYNKLTPLLAEHNVKTINNRKTWPLIVLKQVLEELTNETPHDLLAKEIWCYSNNAATWRRAVRSYSVSVAVMSVIGYVIGLGDRHLDNVLVKLSTGEIVHIDYNVCFEKGKTLRVPEKVPFRMTPNLETALGITGIEGTFRLACEHVLKTLRKERETLLTLLEAFVYDPLVDWAVSDDGTTSNSRATRVLAAAADIMALTANANTSNTSAGAGVRGRSSKKDTGGDVEEGATSESGIGTQDAMSSLVSKDASTTSSTSNDVSGSVSATVVTLDKKQTRKKVLENEVMRDTLTSRFAEIKPEWTQYRNEVFEQLRQMTQYLDDLESQRNQMQKDEYKRDLLTKQMAMIREVETLGTAMSSHSINTLSQRYSVYRKANEEFNQIKLVLKEKAMEYANKIESYLKTLTQANELNINDLQIRLTNLCQLELPNEFDYVKEFLKTSAQEAMYLQADQARKELDASFIQQSYIIKVGLDALMQYNHVINYFPQNILENNRLFRYELIAKDVQNNPENFENALKDLNAMIAEENNVGSSEQVLAYARKLEALWIEENFNLRQNCEDYQSELADVNDLVIDAKNCVAEFIQAEPSALKAIECTYLGLLIDTRNQFHAFERGALQTAPDPSFILTEELNYLKLITDTASSLFMNTEIMEPLNLYLDQLVSIRSSLQALKDIEIYCETNFIPRIFQAVMANRSPIADSCELLKGIEIEIELALEKIDNGMNCEQDFNRIVEVLNNAYSSLSSEHALLFMQFEHLFEVALRKLEESYRDAHTVLQIAHSHHIPDPFLQDVTLNIFENYTISTLRQRFILRKIQAMRNIIIEADTLAQSIFTSDLNTVYDQKILNQPFARFLFEFECNFFFGLGPYLMSLLANELLSLTDTSVLNIGTMPLEVAVPTAVEQNIMLDIYTSTEYAYAQALCVKLCMATKQKMRSDYLNEVITVQNEVINHLQLVSSAHVWLHEKQLPSPPPFGHIIHKSVLLTSFQNAIQNLSAWKISIQKIYDELMSFTRAVVQRLKWAVGANPGLSGLQQMFTECLEKQEVKFKQHCEIAATVLHQCTAVASYESLKVNSQEISKNDEQLRVLIKELSKKSKAQKQSAAMITPVEEGLVQLLDPEGNVDHCWINNVSGLLDEMTDAMQRKIASLEKDLVVTQDNLQMSAHKLRSLMDNELRMDVRYLLKLILKVEKSNQAAKHKQFQSNYKQFLLRINDLHMKVLSKDFTEEIVREIRDAIAKLIEELDDIYEDLLKLTDECGGDGEPEKEKDRRDVKLSGTPLRENKKGNQPEQKRNAYAVSVWRRIRMKLEGRDPDPNRRLSVAEQVDWMIREAMNPDNLAVLYEGWTPWV